MNLYKIFRDSNIHDIDYDECAGFVVQARDEVAAREIAAKHSCDEGEDVWRIGALSSCVFLATLPGPILEGDAQDGVILTDFRAG